MTGHRSDLHSYLQILAGANPAGRLIEIRSRTPQNTMRQTFTPATRIDLAAQTITTLAASADVYVGVLLRHQPAGGRHACDRSHLAFIEIDRPDALARLAQHHCPPSIIVASGTPGHAHAYWQLHHPIDLDQLEHTNRELATGLGGDLACIDAARILRPPTTRSYKHTPPTPVELVALQSDRRYQLRQLTADLSDPPPRQRSTPPATRVARSEFDQLLLAIPAATYIPALTGRQPNRAAKIQCPFHDDNTPSLQLYDHDWYCFGCRIGGSIYDFGAHLWALQPRGHQFLQLRQRLATELHPSTWPQPRNPPGRQRTRGRSRRR